MIFTDSFKSIKMNKSVSFLSLAICLFLVVFIYLKNKICVSSINTHSRIIAITQIAPHGSLDLIHQGIKDTLKPEILMKENIKPVEFIFQNAQGSLSTAAQIATKFITFNPLIIIPISTPSAQSIYSAAKDSHFFTVFAAVSDPTSAKLLPSPENPFVTGVSDLPPVEKQADLIEDILGHLKKNTIGIIYNPGEANAVYLTQLITKALTHRNFQVIHVTASNTMGVSTAAQSLVGKVHAIYLPNDNTVISSLESVLKTCGIHKIPVFSSDPESVQRGCLAAIAPDQYALGQQVGRLVIKLLKGEHIKNLPIEPSEKNILAINLETAHTLGMNISPQLIKKADILIQSFQKRKS